MKQIVVRVDGTSDRRVKNPKTTAQTLQRVLVKVVGLAYAMLKFICNHSFEGVSNGYDCMNKFRKVNLKYLRERAATLQNSGQSLNQFYLYKEMAQKPRARIKEVRVEALREGFKQCFKDKDFQTILLLGDKIP